MGICGCGGISRDETVRSSIVDTLRQSSLRAQQKPHRQLRSLHTLAVSEAVLCQSEASEIIVNNRKRKLIIQEIVSTELSYIRGLQKIYEVFLDPLFERGILRKEVYNKFCSIDVLLKFHQDLWACMKEELTKEDRNEVDLMKRISKHFDGLALYIAFVTQYETILDCLSRMRKDVVINRHFVDCNRNKGYDINAYLILPIQRITRYKILFETLLKNTPLHHDDHVHISQVLGKVKEAVNFTNEVKRQHERAMCLLEVSARIKNLDHGLYKPRRHLIFESSCEFRNEESNAARGYFVVCNDLILTCASDWCKRLILGMKEITDMELEGNKLTIFYSTRKKGEHFRFECERSPEITTKRVPETKVESSDEEESSVSIIRSPCNVEVDTEVIFARDEMEASNWWNMIHKNTTYVQELEELHLDGLSPKRLDTSVKLADVITPPSVFALVENGDHLTFNESFEKDMEDGHSSYTAYTPKSRADINWSSVWKESRLQLLTYSTGNLEDLVVDSSRSSITMPKPLSIMPAKKNDSSLTVLEDIELAEDKTSLRL